MLYSRDFTQLTAAEIALWQQAEVALKKAKRGGGIPSAAYSKYFNTLPLAAQHAQTLFPNNYLPTGNLKNNTHFSQIRKEFELLLNTGAGERQILNFIRDREAAFIVGSVFKNYNFGHHIAFAFREFELPPAYKVDFLLAGKNSMGYEFIFIELESPTGSIVTAEGEFGEVIRKGVKQVEDWEIWLEANYPVMKLVYDRLLSKPLAIPESVVEFDTQLPNEFFELDTTRIHFAVVAGRRKDFTAKAYRKKRKLLKDKGILLLHYDNLLDSTAELIRHDSY